MLRLRTLGMPAPNTHPQQLLCTEGWLELTARLRQVECLVRDSYFTPRPINLYFACATHRHCSQLLAMRS